MNKKWSSDKVKEAQRWIVKRWPESFTQGSDLRPLSLSIHKEVLAHRDESPLLSSRVVREVLKRHTNSYGYLYGLTKHTQRFDLDGNPVGDVSAEHKAWAKETLRHKQKLAQKIRKARRNELKSTGPASVTLKKAASASASSSPVIKYKQTRRKLVKPVTEREVDLAS